MEELKFPLENQAYSEEAMLELLGIDKNTLDDLRREKGFPAIRLTKRASQKIMPGNPSQLKDNQRQSIFEGNSLIRVKNIVR